MRIERGMRRTLLLAGLSVATGGALAQSAGGLPLMVAQGAGGTSYSVPIQTLLFFTALSFLPAVLLLMTGFTRIVIVLSLLRQALGTQAAPPNQVIIGMSLFLTFFVMAPTFDKVYEQAWAPYAAGTMPVDEALKTGVQPLQAAGDRRGRLDLDDEVDGAHVDAEFEAARRHHGRQPSRLEVLLDDGALLAADRAVVGSGE